jgi:hypothetical protein
MPLENMFESLQSGLGVCSRGNVYHKQQPREGLNGSFAVANVVNYHKFAS